ncbi:hypothetical protein Goshw_006679 [Gossypium schwendimanii]|uniref:Uncharacterized protein n=1 Tax=Gossypium schwendimanii TaxID=34291 RepID=A0A7J9LUL3_GOSSC|nr:hypothetical protein [Gossypium schwendimanii]
MVLRLNRDCYGCFRKLRRTLLNMKDALDREAAMQGKRMWEVKTLRCGDKDKKEDESKSGDTGN